MDTKVLLRISVVIVLLAMFGHFLIKQSGILSPEVSIQELPATLPDNTSSESSPPPSSMVQEEPLLPSDEVVDTNAIQLNEINLTLQDINKKYGLEIKNLWVFRNVIINLIYVDENFTGLQPIPNLLFFNERNATHIANYLHEVENVTGQVILQIQYHTDYTQYALNKKFHDDMRNTGYKTWMVSGFINTSGRYSLSNYKSSGQEGKPQLNLSETLIRDRLENSNR